MVIFQIQHGQARQVAKLFGYLTTYTISGQFAVKNEDHISTFKLVAKRKHKQQSDHRLMQRQMKDNFEVFQLTAEI